MCYIYLSCMWRRLRWECDKNFKAQNMAMMAATAAPIGAAVTKGFARGAAPVEVAPVEEASAEVAPVEVAPAVEAPVEAAPVVASVADPEEVEVISSAPAVISRVRQLTESGAILVLESELEVETVRSPEETVNATLHEQDTDSEE